ncbi:hypothetical protein FOZ62_022382, partial [Perkinsus olseni]
HAMVGVNPLLPGVADWWAVLDGAGTALLPLALALSMSAMVKNNVAEGAVLRLSSNLNRPLAGRASVGLMVLSMVISLVVGSGFWSLSLYYLTLASQCMLLAFVLLLALRLSKPPSSSDIFQTTVTIGSIIDADGRQSRRRVPFSKDGSGTR